ncbi:MULTISPECIES: tetratricopeptide repeat-containing sulfotransferase family protein [unclassified Novosphingobium]|uniref:tetratricopeptide repeat-containing sulfotransferase family protein n=1 Tax=unclassified Novosphingobium TaxID=2644732 RepID=UPI00178F1CB4|nr:MULTISPECIES: tetratricopeptide repeat-containing sulfotransferase family protein [unclassified Novosphingobium]NMN06220.1 tetratricopeptide (TPR) repeat protein [Novosphingobium sp. SG919]NMN88517.1 tetratricopeptide (TPR) repeat protein [Novosphingobium sp. SG916]
MANEMAGQRMATTGTANAATADAATTGTGTGSVEAALGHAARLMARQPALALAQAREILRAVPGHPHAVLIEGQVLRVLGRLDEARAVLSALAASQPRAAAAAAELGLTLAALDERAEAAAHLRRAVALKPELAHAWQALAGLLRASGDEAGAAQAEIAGIEAASKDPVLLRAALAMGEGRLDEAETHVRARLVALPDDPAALRLLGEVLWRQGEIDAALPLLRAAVARAPAFVAARELLVRLLATGPDVAEALDHATRLVADDPEHGGHAMLKASLLVRIGDQEGARDLYRAILTRDPGRPRVWLNLGHVEKTIGNQAAAIDAYRRAAALDPSTGEAWWSLANLKTVRLERPDIAAMRAALPHDAVGGDRAEDVAQLHFALGKAYEDLSRDDPAAAESAFAHYARGNALRRSVLDYDQARTDAAVNRNIALFDKAFFASREGWGCPAADPIFVVGLPRSGSTLVEQILASHSQIEGTMELPDMMLIADRLQSRVDANDEDGGEFADMAALLSSLGPDECRRLGEEYLERTRIHRKTDRPHFVDKMPNNWQHVGLIRMILPNATVIDARRHPLGCCFSGWKQYFARGQVFSYDLSEIGRYYAAYVRQMAAFDRVVPQGVHRVIYEDMVADTPGQVRALLAAVGVPFEDGCLAFWQNRRAVRTASSEQVRQPIYTDAVAHWKRFEPWLDPLRVALGPVLDSYPGVPAGW